MSLLQLLRVGRSLANVRDDGHRYKMASENLLPKFNAPPSDSGAGGRGGLPGGTDSLFARQAPDPGPAPGGEVGRKRARGWFWWLGWLFGRRPVRFGPGNAFAAASEKSSRRGARRERLAAAPLIQGELSLETVRVVRNDLSEADLELIPARVRPARPAAERQKPDAEAKRRNGWNRVAGRLFEAARERH